MNQAIIDINEKTFKKGDVLTRPGKSATIVEPAKHRTSGKFIGYYADLLTDGSPMPKRVTLFTADIRNDWKLQAAEEIAPISKHEAKWAGRVAAFLSNNGIVSFFDLHQSITLPREWRFTTNLMTAKAVGECLLGAGCYPVQVESNDSEATRAWSAKAWFDLPAGFFSEVMPEVEPVVDEELTATATLIAQLRADVTRATALVDQKNREIEQLEDENQRLTETSQSAIDHDAAAADRNIEAMAQLHTENDNLTEQLAATRKDLLGSLDLEKRFVSEVGAALGLTGSFRDDYGTDRMIEAIHELTEQLAEARAELASLKSNSPAVPAADVTSLRCEEVKTLHQKMGSPSAREDADRELAAHLNSGWQKFDCSYVLGDMSSFRFVTLTRTITPAPVAPEPRASFSVKPVGNMVTIIPTEPAPAAHVRFNAEEYLANMLDDCQKAAEEAIADQLPAYEAILNPRPLALGVGNPVKPEVR